jgi:hypothetical protein
LDESVELLWVGGSFLQYRVKLPEVVVGLECREALDGLDARRNGTHEFVGGRDSEICDSFVLEFHGIAEAFAVGVFYKTFVSAVVLRQRLEVPPIDGMESPGASCV